VTFEFIALRMHFLPHSFRLFLMIVCASMGLGVVTYPVIDLTRGLVLNFTFWFVLLVVGRAIIQLIGVRTRPLQLERG
jgi:hypothetical protein